MTALQLQSDFTQGTTRTQELLTQADAGGMVSPIVAGRHHDGMASRAIELQDGPLLGYLGAMGLVEDEGAPRYVTGPRGVLGDVGDRQRAGEKE